MTNTPYYVSIAPAAQRHIHALHSKNQKMIIKFLESLAINPRPLGVTKIEGMIGLYAETVDKHRLIYKVEEQEVLLLLVV